MSLRSLEAAILSELKVVSKNSRIRQKDIMEWQTGKDLICQQEESLFFLPLNQVSVCVRDEKKEEKKLEEGKEVSV
ncbi:MAG: hypothetical protein M0Z77_07360 [Thermoplasmatales archaeon]|nr:hypothetical protein [Thermoplasmatales archaeon]